MCFLKFITKTVLTFENLCTVNVNNLENLKEYNWPGETVTIKEQRNN